METRTIFKWRLNTTDIQEIEVPEGFVPLCVQVQDGDPFLWAQVEPTAPKTLVSIRIVGTGHAYNPEEIGRYIGTYQLMGGSLVFHVFIK